MERFLILFTMSTGFAPCIASVVSVGGNSIPPNSQAFYPVSNLLTALQRAGIPESLVSPGYRAVADSHSTFIEVDEQQARLFASGHYERV